ncbi:MAG TPA: BMP family ABC transporter substrate-binding protein [Stellaceae bacterium]|nr:BMP family ABC transporter substrate-binding protein [Stellaceae bacterium]
MRGLLTAVAISAACCAGPAAARVFQPAIVYDVGVEGNPGFNEDARRGVDLFRHQYGIAALEYGVGNPTQREQVFASVARGNADLIVGLGAAQRGALEAAARAHPEKKFTLIDAESDLPNVQSLSFRQEEGAYLVGMLAAMASTNRKIGYIGGSDIPLVRRIAAGYVAGARYAEPEIPVLMDMAGSTPAAWQNPTRGAQLARSQFGRGADVVFAVAGATGLGALQAAAEGRRLAIGFDADQDYLYPGTMLTSLVKRYDVAVYDAFRSALTGTWRSGPRSLGLAEKAVDYTLDDYNDALLTRPMRDLVEDVRADIIAGKIKVPDRLQP